MAIQAETTILRSASPLPIPPLEFGDRLTRMEFERRYAAMPELKKAELLDGIVYFPYLGLVPYSEHRLTMSSLLVAYSVHTPGTDGNSHATVRLDQDNEPQPGALLRIQTSYGGKSEVGPDGFLEGAPELVVEVASSSVSYDLHDKLKVYRRAGVLEYVVSRVRDEDIDWFVLREGRYDRLPADAAGVFRSQVFPGFWLDRAAALRGDAAAMMATLQQGIASPEHAAFVARLQQAAAASQK